MKKYILTGFLCLFSFVLRAEGAAVGMCGMVCGQEEPEKDSKDIEELQEGEIIGQEDDGAEDVSDSKDKKDGGRKDRKNDDAGVKGEPEITFESVEHDFGAIPENGKKVSYDYTFTNTGDRPLVITRVITSCKCVSTSFTKKPVPPGEQGVVTVTYDPKKQLGVFYKAIQVYSNASPKLSIIIAKGEVKQ